MKFENIINSIRLTLEKSDLIKQFDIAYYISFNEEERAYNLGLFFRKIEQDNQVILSELKDHVLDLQDYYHKRYLKEYFMLKKTCKHKTRINYWPYFFLILGIVIIFLSIKSHLDGQYSVSINLKTKLPVYMTGLLGLIIGLAVCFGAISLIRQNNITRNFYKTFDPGNNRA